MKLKAYGITGNLLRWIENFLTNRTQRVVINGIPSDPLPVWSGVPQGSVIGPLLFLIYINDLLDNLKSKGKLFADDSKIFRKIVNPDDRVALQEDLNKLREWSRKWMLEFNESKCKVMHISLRKTNPEYVYYMNDKVLDKTELEKDLGVFVASNWKTSAHVAKVAARANSMLGRIRHTFTYINKDIFMKVYPSLVRTHMEFAVQAWSPQLKKDIEILEKVQARATKLVPEISNLSYPQRLIELGLTTLVERRKRGDLIEVFKIMHGFDNLDRSQFFTMRSEVHSYRTIGHSYHIYRKRANLQIRKEFFDIRIIEAWNELPEEVVNCKTLSSFKKALDRRSERRRT